MSGFPRLRSSSAPDPQHARCADGLLSQSQRSRTQRRCRRRHAFALGVARCARHDRHQIRLRARAVRRLHRACRRRGRCAPASRRVVSIGDRAVTTIEGVGDTPQGNALQQAWLDLEVAAMRLLPVRPDHVGCGAAGQQAEPERCRHRRRHGRQHLPLRHLSTHPRRDPSRARPEGGSTMPDGSPDDPARPSQLPEGRRRARRRPAPRPSLLPPALRHALAAARRRPLSHPNAFMRIDRQGAVTLVMPMVEMGQGVYTSMPMLVAEELEVDLDQVRLEHAPANDALYANPIFGRPDDRPARHRSAGSGSRCVRPARSLRTLLIAAAAKRWGVDPGHLPRASTAWSRTRPAPGAWPMAHWRTRLPRCRCRHPTASRSRIRRTSRCSASRPAPGHAAQGQRHARNSASTSSCPGC